MHRPVALSLLLLFCTGARADDQAVSCNEHPLASLPLYFAPDSAMATDVDIGAPQPLEFRIDLIGGDTELRDDVAAALNLRQTGVPPTEVHFKSGQLIEHRAVIPHVRLGGVDAGETKAYLLPWPSGGAAPLTPAIVVGTLGSDVFNQYDVELDLAHGTMNLFPPARCDLPLPARSNSARVPLERSTLGPKIPILIDGKEADGDIRTASCCSHMKIRLAHSLFGLDASAPGVTAEPGAAGTSTYSFNFGNLVIGGVSMPNPRIALVELHERWNGLRGWGGICVSCEHVQLGLRELIHFHLYFAFEKHTVFVAPASR